MDTVLVTVDTLRYDAVGFDGNPRNTSPNLDRVAREGVVFDFAHAHNVVTLPSHVNILTGLYPYQHGVRDNSGFRLADNIPTMATILKERGYATGAFVAAFPLDARYGLWRGFDVYDQHFRGLGTVLDFSMQQRRADDVVGAALPWYRSQSGRPRFLWVHLFDPHAPYDPPESVRGRFKDDLYLGEVAFADAALAPLLDLLRSADAPPTLLVVTGDHGEARGDHGETTHGLFAYEATLRVPLLLWCPGILRPGRDAGVARHVDILPTVLEAAGVPSPLGLAGVSLLSRHRREAPAENYFEAFEASLTRGWAPLRGFAEDRLKFIELPRAELYDLRADPAENYNLLDEKPEWRDRLRRRLAAVPLGPLARGVISGEEAAKLRSLGYLTGSAAPKKSYGPEDDPKTLVGLDQQLHELEGLYHQGQLDRAIALGRQIIASNPKMLSGYEHLAFVLHSQGRLDEAVQLLDRASGEGLRSEKLTTLRAMMLEETGRAREALELLSPFGESENVELLNSLGIALSAVGRFDDAIAAFRRSLRFDPQNIQAFQNMGVACLEVRRFDEARHYLEMALSLNAHNPQALGALGFVLASTGKPREALEAWSKSLLEDPRQYDLLLNAGFLAAQVGNVPVARNALERFVTTAPPGRYRGAIEKARQRLASLPPA